jgi:hypothetical protein
MFAFFGLGVQEMVILLIVGLLLIGGLTLAVFIALSLKRRLEGMAPADAVTGVRAYVEGLRQDLQQLKQRSA